MGYYMARRIHQGPLLFEGLIYYAQFNLPGTNWRINCAICYGLIYFFKHPIHIEVYGLKNQEESLKNKTPEGKRHKNICEELEILQAKQHNFNIHKKVKELAGLRKNRRPTLLTDQNGKISLEIKNMEEIRRGIISR